MLAGLFLLAHGLVHVGIWCAPYDPAKAPYDPRHSWLTARPGLAVSARRFSVMLAMAAAVLFLISGVAVIAGAAWAGAVAISGAVVSLLLTILVFNRWLSFNLLINIAIIGVVLANG